ncbi:alpha/beta hydrolase [Pontibacter sp. BT310]|uniref:Alpha/beta hydrolase n=1 Tax=Pontibacter populi TaxID=890055 RepID=A0ABS6XF99_9BACT|nr:MULTISPECIES: alpha/beta hydrolase [Pontibacter]MBJ6118942.1 alpha/beta hydrolase [Pontibacter sp. BT310]MBR0571370.1 alpha/beta hydrolase [Microvirga sp. STS03]MBW3365796.1 alpha/beta hydrolase [Pontibacter populi]
MTATQIHNVKVFGNGQQPMLFAHGYGCDQKMWRFITPAFENEYKIVLFDHIGFGASDTSSYTIAKYSSLNSYADDILAICEELDLKDIIYVGHSVSAMIGVLASNKQPERFSKLVLIGPSPCYINDGDYTGGFTEESILGLIKSLESDYLTWAKTMAPVIMGNPDRPELGEELSNSFCSSDIEVAKDFARVTFLSDNRSDLANVTTDTLILQCSEDVIAPEVVGNYVHQHIAGSKFEQMQAIGHCPNLSAPDETIAKIKNFIKN